MRQTGFAVSANLRKVGDCFSLKHTYTFNWWSIPSVFIRISIHNTRRNTCEDTPEIPRNEAAYIDISMTLKEPQSRTEILDKNIKQVNFKLLFPSKEERVSFFDFCNFTAAMLWLKSDGTIPFSTNCKWVANESEANSLMGVLFLTLCVLATAKCINWWTSCKNGDASLNDF